MVHELMTAVRIHGFGGPRVLQVDAVPVPVPAAGEVLVRVVAAALNPPDWYVREGLPGLPKDQLPPFDMPLTLGTDVSGTVVALGDDVRELSLGDEVFGLLRFPVSMQAGAYAQYVAAPVADLARKPSGIDHRSAAGAAMAALTAWQFLIDHGADHVSPFQPEEHVPRTMDANTTVLVNGAAGGVGHFAVQLAKWRGARVIAVASTAHEDFLRDLGADEFIDYTVTRPEDVAGEVDVVLDTVGGPASRRLLPILKRGGALYPVFLAEFDPDEVARYGVTVSLTQVRADGTQLAQIASLLEASTLRTAIDSAYPLDHASEAHERAARGHIRGKIILDVP